MAVALSGARLLCIDNIRAGDPLGSPALDAAVTAGDDYEIGRIGDRVLGETSETEAPWRCVVIATGNNLVVSGDLDRRGLLCRLQSDLATPETRIFRHYPKLLEHVRKRRPALLTDALTVLIAHKRAVEAGEPDTVLSPIGSFGGWSSRIRSAVWWADPEGCDPWEANRELREQALPERAEALAFLVAWHCAFGEQEITTAEIDQRCRENQALAAAVADLDLAPPRGSAAVNTRSLGAWLTAHAGQPGAYMLHKGTGARKWFVVAKPLTKVDRAIQDLMTDCPDLSIFGILFDSKALHRILKRLREVDLVALRDLYKDGRNWADALKQAADLVGFQYPNKVKVCVTTYDSMKTGYPELNDKQRAALWLVRTTFSMAWGAELTRQLGPVGEQIRDRFNKLNPTTVSQGVAWNMLREADWALGPDIDAKELVWEAVQILNVEWSKLNQTSPQAAKYYDTGDIETAIRELAGFQPLKDADLAESEDPQLEIY